MISLALTTYVNREIFSLFHLSYNVIRFVLSIFEWPFFTCFTVLTFQSRYITLYVIKLINPKEMLDSLNRTRCLR